MFDPVSKILYTQGKVDVRLKERDRFLWGRGISEWNETSRGSLGNPLNPRLEPVDGNPARG